MRKFLEQSITVTITVGKKILPVNKSGNKQEQNDHNNPEIFSPGTSFPRNILIAGSVFHVYYFDSSSKVMEMVKVVTILDGIYKIRFFLTTIET